MLDELKTVLSRLTVGLVTKIVANNVAASPHEIQTCKKEAEE